MLSRAVVAMVVCAASLLSQPSVGAQDDPRTSSVDPSAEIFKVQGRRPKIAVVTVGDTLPALPVGVSAGQAPGMLLEHRGIAAVLTGQQLGVLMATPLPRQPSTTWSAGVRTLWTVHLATSEDGPWKRVALGHDEAGIVLAQDHAAASDAPAAIELDRARFAALVADWPRVTFPTPPSPDPPVPASLAALRPGELLEWTVPRTPLWLAMRAPSVRPGLLDAIGDPGASIGLPIQPRLFVRSPRSWHAHKPPGLLVWCHAAEVGEPPDQVLDACDSLGLVCVGISDVGNSRVLVDRTRGVLEAIATVQRHTPIDRARVYVAGISGGARVASIIQGSMPDVVQGCVAIVALAGYQPSPAGNGRYWRAEYQQPSGPLMRMLRVRRIAGISGERDANLESMRARVRDLSADGVQARMFEHDMGHEMCTAEAFDEALRWVDEPARAARDKAEVEADEIVRKILGEPGSAPQPWADRTVQQRRLLLRAMEIAPWSSSAWRALAAALDDPSLQQRTQVQRSEPEPPAGVQDRRP